MLKTFLHLLGDDAPVFRRYVWMATAYGVLCGLTMAALAPVLRNLLDRNGTGALAWLAALLMGVVLSWAWRRSVEQAGVRVGVAVLRGGRHRLGEHVMRLPMGWFTAANSAQLGHVVTQGMMSVAQLPAHVFTPVIAGIVVPLVLVAILFVLHWPLGVIGLLALPLFAGVLALTARLSRHADAVYQRQFADASQRVVEFAQAQSVLRAFNGEGGSTRWIDQAVGEQRASATRLICMSAGAATLNAGLVQAVFAVMLIAAAAGVTTGSGIGVARSDALAVIIALLLAVRVIDSLLEVAGYGEVLRGARGHLDAIRNLFDAAPLPEPDPSQARAPLNASVAMQDVRFRYAADAPDVLRDVSLQVAPGSMTALIGESGSGKTTVVRLMARFFDVNAGCITMGGVDVRHIPTAQLAGQVSQIFQDSTLFSGSIADNIRAGKPDASMDDVLRAASHAGLDRVIARLPQGVDTSVGEGGTRLSGGERQRIAIARALIKDAPILLVDEATAALDADNQAVITQTLARLRGHRTVIVIAHQLSTIAMADQIVVLEGGRVVEQGTPAALASRESRYARFMRERRSASGWRIAADAPGTERHECL